MCGTPLSYSIFDVLWEFKSLLPHCWRKSRNLIKSKVSRFFTLNYPTWTWLPVITCFLSVLTKGKIFTSKNIFLDIAVCFSIDHATSKNERHCIVLFFGHLMALNIIVNPFIQHERCKAFKRLFNNRVRYIVSFP